MRLNVTERGASGCGVGEGWVLVGQVNGVSWGGAAALPKRTGSASPRLRHNETLFGWPHISGHRLGRRFTFVDIDIQCKRRHHR